MLRVGIVAGEASGDRLGAELIQQLKKYYPQMYSEGIGGAAMISESFRSFYPIEKLSIIGLYEIIRCYSELRTMQSKITQHFITNKPDIFIGIDAPEFTLPIEKALKEEGIKTVHYVSPSVWAWREGRLKGIAQSINLMLTLFPFEKDYYQKNDIPVSYVGHPLAKSIAFENSPIQARNELGLDVDVKYLALLPGSRKAEIDHLAPEFFKTLKICQKKYPGLKGIVGLHNEKALHHFECALKHQQNTQELAVFIGKTQTVMAAANVLLIASGTATLEGALIKRPMVVAYKANWFSYLISLLLVKVPYVSLPNILARKFLVPEFIQNNCTAEKLAEAVMDWLSNKNKIKDVMEEFKILHHSFESSGIETAATVIHNLIENKC